MIISIYEYILTMILIYFGINMILFLFTIISMDLIYKKKGKKGIEEISKERVFKNKLLNKISHGYDKIVEIAFFPTFYIIKTIDKIYITEVRDKWEKLTK